jgi:hypothetical protein
MVSFSSFKHFDWGRTRSFQGFSSSSPVLHCLIYIRSIVWYGWRCEVGHKKRIMFWTGQKISMWMWWPKINTRLRREPRLWLQTRRQLVYWQLCRLHYVDS